MPKVERQIFYQGRINLRFSEHNMGDVSFCLLHWQEGPTKIFEAPKPGQVPGGDEGAAHRNTGWTSLLPSNRPATIPQIEGAPSRHSWRFDIWLQ